MNESYPPRHLLRRSGAILAGFLLIVILSVATDAVLHATGVFPPLGEPMSDPLFLLSLVYRIVYGVAGAYVTARLAPDRPLLHALALGTIGLVISMAGAVAMWDAAPPWFSLAVIAIALPTAWLGGRLRQWQLNVVRPR